MLFYLVVVIYGFERTEAHLTDMLWFLGIKLAAFLAFKRFYETHDASKMSIGSKNYPNGF